MITFLEHLLDIFLVPVGHVYDTLWRKLGIRWQPAIASLWTGILVVFMASRLILLGITSLSHPAIFAWSLISTFAVGQLIALIAFDLWRFRVGGNVRPERYAKHELNEEGDVERADGFSFLLVLVFLVILSPLVWFMLPDSCLLGGVEGDYGLLSTSYLFLSRLSAILLFIGLVSFAYPAGDQDDR